MQGVGAGGTSLTVLRLTERGGSGALTPTCTGVRDGHSEDLQPGHADSAAATLQDHQREQSQGLMG